MNFHNEVFLNRARQYYNDPSMYNVIKDLKDQRFSNKVAEFEQRRVAMMQPKVVEQDNKEN